MFFEPRRGLNIKTSSQVPAGAGLGGSSALNIALCGGLARVTGKRCTRSTILEIAKNVEAIVIRVPTGWQDYFPALYGGANSVHLERDGVKVNACQCPSPMWKSALCSATPANRAIPPSTIGRS